MLSNIEVWQYPVFFPSCRYRHSNGASGGGCRDLCYEQSRELSMRRLKSVVCKIRRQDVNKEDYWSVATPSLNLTACLSRRDGAVMIFTQCHGRGRVYFSFTTYFSSPICFTCTTPSQPSTMQLENEDPDGDADRPHFIIRFRPQHVSSAHPRILCPLTCAMLNSFFLTFYCGVAKRSIARERKSVGALIFRRTLALLSK
jgi:hypothetical protein